MMSSTTYRASLHVEIETWPLVSAFKIAGHVFEAIDVVVVSLEADGQVGRGEAVGVYYRHDDAQSIVTQLERVRSVVESGICRDTLQQLLPLGGARNALDCALWDLEAKITRRFVWQVAGLQEPRPLLTTFTCGADEPMRMAVVARGYERARALKIKLTGEPIDADRVRAVREARPDVWLGVDGNQGFTRPFMERLMAVLVEMRVSLIEQPFPVGSEALLDGLHSPIQIAADESAQGLCDIAGLAGRFQVVNIKLDKCGGLTEALAMAHAAVEQGLNAMVGNMIGTSLAMAPAFIVGQLCTLVDLDGPVVLKGDRTNPVEYFEGTIMCPSGLWGGAHSAEPAFGQPIDL